MFSFYLLLSGISCRFVFLYRLELVRPLEIKKPGISSGLWGCVLILAIQKSRFDYGKTCVVGMIWHTGLVPTLLAV